MRMTEFRKRGNLVSQDSCLVFFVDKEVVCTVGVNISFVAKVELFELRMVLL